MSTDEHPNEKAMSAIIKQVQDLIEMATYETQTDVAATLAHWTASIVAGEIRDATLSVFATSDPETGDVVERIVVSDNGIFLVLELPRVHDHFGAVIPYKKNFGNKRF